MVSASRIKYYPYQDVMSLTFYHGFHLLQNTQLAYQIQTKFRMNHLVQSYFQRIRERNQHVFKMQNESLLGFDKQQTIITLKTLNRKMVIENSAYINLYKYFKIPIQVGLYNKN
jgi:hypothetical protein